MSATTLTPKDSPLMREWEKYSSTEEYENAFRYAACQQHRTGSMWNAFMSGFLAANPDGAKSDSENNGAPSLRQMAIHFAQKLNIVLGLNEQEAEFLKTLGATFEIENTNHQE